MMTDSHFSISSFSHHKSGVIRRQVGVKSASSRRQVGVRADTAYPLNNMRETAGVRRRPAPKNPRRIFKNKGSPLSLEKPIKFSLRKSCAKLRHHVTHSQIMRSTRISFTNHPQIIRNRSTHSDPNHNYNSPIPHHPQQRGGLCEACRIPIPKTGFVSYEVIYTSDPP